MSDCISDCQYDAFVSYSSKDLPWVKNVLLKRLEDGGLKVCIDFRDFVPGLSSIKNIERAILTSRKTILVITPDYLESSWTAFEAIRVHTADPANEKLRFIPILKEKCTVYLGYIPFTYLNFADPEDEDLEWGRLLAAIVEPPTPIKQTEAIRLHACMKDVFPNEDDLRDLCFAYFKEVRRKLRETDRWPYIAREIISHCESHGATDVLWNVMRQKNAVTTAKYECSEVLL